MSALIGVIIVLVIANFFMRRTVGHHDSTHMRRT